MTSFTLILKLINVATSSKVDKFYLFLNLDEASLAEGVEAMKDFRVREGAAAQGTVGAQGKDRAQGRHP